MRSIIALCVIAVVGGCTAKTHELSTGPDPAHFVPVVGEFGVEIFVDEIDGNATKFGEFDRVTIDPGPHEIVVRLEYQPAAGSSLVVGGIGNLLLRAATNETFRARLSIDLEPGQTYRLAAKHSESDGVDLILFDETAEEEVLRYSFMLADGAFERVF